MSLSTADYLVDRRRLRKQVTFWRVVAFVVAALAIIGLGLRFAVKSGVAGTHIARLSISGVITGDADTVKLIRSVANSKTAVAAVLTIDSPGGTTEGSEVLYEEIRRLAAKKPVVAVVGTVAASGAYIAALGADRIFVRGNSIVGSIGVLMQFPNVSGLMDKLGVKLESIKSSPLKAAPNGMEPTSEAARDRDGGSLVGSRPFGAAFSGEDLMNSHFDADLSMRSDTLGNCMRTPIDPTIELPRTKIRSAPSAAI